MTSTSTSTSTSVGLEPAGDDGIARIVLDRPDDTVNAINLDMIEALAEAIRAVRSTQPKGLIITSAKTGQWMAGADLKLVSEAADSGQIEAASRRLQAVFDELAWLPCTTVAAINGAALGGGLELALACDYRVASDASSVVIGQPEVNLGLVPAGGGTQRLPRLIGLERSLDLILTGRRLNARRARRAGLLDEVVHPAVLEQAARTWATSKPKRPLDRPIELGLTTRAALEVAEQTPPGRQLIYRQARKSVLDRTHGHYPAPLKALEAIQTGLEHGMAAGLEAEARSFGELAMTPIARNLIWLFLETQRARRRGAPVAQLGVVGAGFMGAAIAEVAASSGMSVRVKDVTTDAVGRGLATIRRLVDDGVRRRRLERREGQAILGRVSGTTDYSGFGRADLVIEAAFEDARVKRQIVAELERALKPEAVIASNTSAIPIHEIAADARHPERIVGMHFFSPAERMPLLEVVRPAASADAAIATAVAVGTRLGKTVIVVKDAPGFYTTRVLGVMLNEAALLLNEGTRLEDVDRAMTDFGFPVGPFVLFDEVGLEVARHAGETVARAFGDRLPAATIVADLVARGETGRKVGRGFYLWPKPAPHNTLLRRVTRQPRRVANPYVYTDVPRTTMNPSEIQDRLALLFVNEAVRCLDEGVLESPTDGDLGAVLGLGFPPFRGGPFHFADTYADTLGAGALTARLRALADRHGARYAPAESLARGRRFFEEPL